MSTNRRKIVRSETATSYNKENTMTKIALDEIVEPESVTDEYAQIVSALLDSADETHPRGRLARLAPLDKASVEWELRKIRKAAQNAENGPFGVTVAKREFIDPVEDGSEGTVRLTIGLIEPIKRNRQSGADVAQTGAQSDDLDVPTTENVPDESEAAKPSPAKRSK